MKKIVSISLLLILVAVFMPLDFASAAAKAGVKPGSFFYFFDTTFEKINLFFTLNSEKKAQKALGYADERLAEIEAIAEEKNPDAVKTAITNYESNIALATEKSKEVKDKVQAENLLASIADNTSKHQEILSDVLSKVPDEAKEAITQAIEASRKGQEEATKQIAELKGEVEQLKQEVAELKTQNEEQEKTIEEINKQEPEAKSTPVKPLTPNNQQTTPTTVKLSNLNSFIDSAIVVYQNNITFSYKVVDQIDDFINHLKKGRALAQAYLDVDTEPYFINGWKLIISEGVEKPLKYEEDVRATFLNNINLMKQDVADLENEKNKNLLSAPVSVEQYWTYYDQLKEKIKVEEFSKTISDNYDKFYTYASQKEKELNTAMMVFADKELAYYKSNVDFWNGINASRQTSNYAQINNYSQPTYQPPILQMPKITHCTISGDGGVGIQAYIDCTTSSF